MFGFVRSTFSPAASRQGIFLKRYADYMHGLLTDDRLSQFMNLGGVVHDVQDVKCVLINLSSVIRDYFLTQVENYGRRRDIPLPDPSALADPASPHCEDEHSLFCISGGAIARMVRLCRKKKQTSFLKLLSVVSMSKQQKTDLLPSSIRTRDWGGLHIPQRVFLTWLRHLDMCIRDVANLQAYRLHGKKLIEVTITRVSDANERLFDVFLKAVQYCLQVRRQTPEAALVEHLYRIWTRKIIHTRVNEFIVAFYQNLADAENEKVKGGQTLRDTLYNLSSNPKTKSSKPKNVDQSKSNEVVRGRGGRGRGRGTASAQNVSRAAKGRGKGK